MIVMPAATNGFTQNCVVAKLFKLPVPIDDNKFSCSRLILSKLHKTCLRRPSWADAILFETHERHRP